MLIGSTIQDVLTTASTDATAAGSSSSTGGMYEEQSIKKSKLISFMSSY